MPEFHHEAPEAFATETMFAAAQPDAAFLILRVTLTPPLKEQGGAANRLPMGSNGSRRAFSYRMQASVFHTLQFESDAFTDLGTATGPFDPATSEAAP